MGVEAASKVANKPPVAITWRIGKDAAVDRLQRSGNTPRSRHDKAEQRHGHQIEADQKDRRAKKVVLSPKARPLIERIESIAVQLRKELFAGVSEEEQRLCQDIHARILGNLEKG